MPMLNKSKTLTGMIPVCLWQREKAYEPCRLIPGRARTGHSQSAAWPEVNLAATRPRALNGLQLSRHAINSP